MLAVVVLAACTPATIPTQTTIQASSPAPQPTVSPTQTVSIADLDNNAINITDLRLDQPGPGSEVVSPLHLSAQIPPSPGVLRVELFGEDGRLLVRQVFRAAESQLELELVFDPTKPGENARLALSLDDEFGRLQELTSTEIVLLAEGEDKLVAGPSPRLLAIESPQSGDSVDGGTLTIRGVVSGPAGSLNIQLITREGRILDSIDLAGLTLEDEKKAFTSGSTYNLSAAAWVQVAVSFREAGIITAFKSVEVWVIP